MGESLAGESSTVRELANAVSNQFEAQVHLYSGSIDDHGFGELLKTLQPNEKQPFKSNIVLILTTSGGLANAAYRIARTLQNTFARFHLYVPAYCKSAGTLIALGAHELIIESVGELGPLDVQLVQRDEIGQRKSGMVMRTAFEGLAQETLDVFDRIMMGIKVASQGSISFDTAARIASTIAPAVMSPVYAQINPEDLGNDLRDLHVATQYGKRLIVEGQNCKSGAVDHLVSGYPSHDFIIDRMEAENLFQRVNLPDESLALLTNELGSFVYREHDPKVILRLDQIEEPQESGEKDDNAASGKPKAESTDLDTGRSETRRRSPKRQSKEAG